MLRRADLRTMGLLCLLTVAYAMHFRGGSHGSHWLLLPCIVLAVTACAAKHNHTHCATFSSRWANRLLDFWLGIVTGSSTTGIRFTHQVLHHGRPQSSTDPVRPALVAQRSALRALLGFVPEALRESWRAKRSAADNGKAVRTLDRILLQERLVLWGFIAAGLFIDWQRFLVTFALPWICCQWFLLAMNLPQHDGCDARHPLAHSRNFTGRFSNWLFLNSGYHTAHHARPRLHWSELPAWHQQNLTGRIPAELECRSLAGFWWSWWKARNSSFTHQAVKQPQPEISCANDPREKLTFHTR